MRRVHGEMHLYDGLVILILAPEAYLPLRQVGAQYHAAAEGLAAAEDIFSVLERPVPASGARPGPARGGAEALAPAEDIFSVLERPVPASGTGPVPADGALAFEDVTVRYPGRAA